MDKFTCDDLQIIKGKYFCYRDLCRKDCTKESCEKWIINQIKQEHKRSIKIHGEFPDDIFKCFCILQEEVCEVAKEINDGNKDIEALRTELIQVGAMALKFLICIDSMKNNKEGL